MFDLSTNAMEAVFQIFQEAEAEDATMTAAQRRSEKFEQSKIDSESKLPKLYKNTLGMSPAILKSALFSSASRGKRAFYVEDFEVASLSDSKVFVQGEELRQDDLNVLLNLIKTNAGKFYTLGIDIDARKFAVATLGWADSGDSVEKLKACIRRLKKTNITIINKNGEKGMSFINEHDFNGNHVKVELSKQVVNVMSDTVTFLSHAERLQLKDGLETWLYGAVKADAWFAPVPLNKLHAASGTGLIQKEFNRALKVLLEKFVKYGLIQSFEIKASLLTIKK